MWEFLEKAVLSQSFLRLPVNNDPGNPDLAYGTADTGIYAQTSIILGFALNGSRAWYMDGAALKGTDGTGAALINTGATSTVPTLCPNRSDLDTGIGRHSSDTLSLIAGGVECARVDKSVVANDARFLLWDVTAGSMQRVTIGAAGSGGVGYRLLRIPN